MAGASVHSEEKWQDDVRRQVALFCLLARKVKWMNDGGEIRGPSSSQEARTYNKKLAKDFLLTLFIGTRLCIYALSR